jgi:hypothetical protein
MFIAYEFLLCSPAQQPLYALTWKHQSAVGVRTGELLGLYMPPNAVSVFLSSFILCLIAYLHFWTWLYSITMFLQRQFLIKASTGS